MLTKRLMQIKKHSRRVLITKRTLPVFAFLIVALIVVWPQFNQNNDRFSLAVPSNGKQAQMEMENLRFFGLNNKKLPMTLQTPSVKQMPDSNEQARMNKPTGTYQLDSGDTMIVNAPYALINQKKETVFFEDRINIKTDSGYTGYTSQVLCDYTQGTADGDSPVSISGPAGKLNAQGIWMADKGNLILFKKKTTAVIKNKNQNMTVSAKNGIQIDQKARTLTAMDDVKVSQEQNTLTAKRAVLYYTDNKNNRVQKIEAFGDVKIDNKKQSVTGEKAVYTPKTQIAEITGNVVVAQGTHKMKGEKAVVNMATGKSELISPKRITGQLMPNDIKGE
ncbi:MAG: LPS export ABC transporter periplasmic protein LptC [Alphaproteobacteria bacterium]|nr:LPS export ABC transporter periplasmic protein LptC [Alphaproteobacteria bacterium]